MLASIVTGLAFGLLSSASPVARSKPNPPFLINVDDETAILGNDFWNATIGRQYGTKLYYKNVDLVGDAWGHYVSYNGAQSDLNLTNARIHKVTGDYTDVVFTATEGEFHWVLTPTLTGAYQYFVNKALPTLGEFRTLWRLANDSFTHGWTDERNEALPPLSDIVNAVKIQDETWQQADGTYITKYDFATFLPVIEGQSALWGLYGPLGGQEASGEQVGSWYIHGGKDYLNGNHLKQELLVHRESQTGDAVQLNMIHGTHYQAVSSDVFPEGKTWGPWLWYLNDGSIQDAATRAKEEIAAWPYDWMQDSHGYHSRGSLRGRIVLSDGQAASGAAVFLGDNQSNTSTLDQGAWYYYRTYADENGYFTLENVREGTWGLRVFAAGGDAAGGVTSVLEKNNISVHSGEALWLGDVTWAPQGREVIWQIGEVDRKATGFAYSGAPHQFARGLNCPANLTFTVGTSQSKDWCFEQSSLGTWTVEFDLPRNSTSQGRSAVLSVALAGFSAGSSATVSVNGVSVGAISSSVLASDPSSYRCGTLAGEWHLLEFPVSADALRNGANSVEFTITKSTLFRGWIYDSVLLGWA
ncbi:putative rhamnogalacturonase [Aspergillus fijiensis CBS 313.89]|uniref:rhamnogalacturonan endolyase n=1 Tax=Aspergillus fijiensis CBS 313.89 TaxID=1448319 RepID=A0A8G1RS84_9EURO|nr:polysaccharide lyase family 4 protein [Aspergillus fijiensis CBS 313.89]RAK76945.1 polysaccharide lyase family 4 protein [Aspergillus fijiensis CBS 313.89]